MKVYTTCKLNRVFKLSKKKFTLFLILNTASKGVYHFNLLNLIDLLQPVIMIFFV